MAPWICVDAATCCAGGPGHHVTIMGKHPKIPQTVLVRSMGLLPIMYQTRALAEELGITPQLLVQWIRLGAPHTRDKTGRAWITGREFADWVDLQRRQAAAAPQSGGPAFCPRCRVAINIEDPAFAALGASTVVTGTCPRCGGPVSRKKRNGK